MCNIVSPLLDWYDRNARTLPWRGIQNPYYTWVSETMLQQTRVETVIPYYHRFLSKFPTLESLAAAPETEVLKQWEGLGYYSRARNLWKGAQQVLRDFGGALPTDPEALRCITGIGPYTAGAIASIAFGQRVPAVDGNVIRVLCRLFGLRENARTPALQKRLDELARSLVPAERPGDYNQAVMDLGAKVCVPGTPDCDRCPLQSCCDAFHTGDAEDLPVLPRSKPPRVIHYDVPLIFSGGLVLMRRRTEALLRGLWVFPLVEADPGVEPDLKGFLARTLLPETTPQVRGHARHVFTHLVWEMRLLSLEMPKAAGEISPGGDYQWIALTELKHLALPVAMRGALRVLQADGRLCDWVP